MLLGRVRTSEIKNEEPSVAGDEGSETFYEFSQLG
jgi:hypothetical protein